MNQIDVLKNISEFGNPKDRPEVLKYYNQYKNDPTFRNLAISLAESETGYSSLDDSTKKVYQTYKDSLGKQVPVKAVEQPTQIQQEQKSIPSQILSGMKTGLEEMGSGIKTGIENTFPRTTGRIQQEEPLPYQGILGEVGLAGKNLYQNIIPSVLDVASLPGRTFTALAKSTSVPATPSELNADIGQIGSTQGGVPGIVEDIARSPFNVMPGIGEVGGAVVPKLAQGLGRIITNSPAIVKGIAPVLENAANASLMGAEQNVSEDKSPGDNLLINAGLGAGLGLIPGIYAGIKGKNLSDMTKLINEDFAQPSKLGPAMKVTKEKVEKTIPYGAQFIKSELDKAGIYNIPEVPKDIIGQAQFIKDYGDLLRPELGKNFVNPSKLPQNKDFKLSLPDYGLGLASVVDPRILPYAIGFRTLESVSDKAPLIEKIVANSPTVSNPIIQGLGKGIGQVYRDIAANPAIIGNPLISSWKATQSPSDATSVRK